MKYIGVEEMNDWEGETFGYYFEYSTKVENKLREIQEKMEQFDSDWGLEFILEPIEEEELMTIHKYDENGYKERVNIYNADSQPWDEFLDADYDNECPFYKGNGLVDRMDIFSDIERKIDSEDYDEEEEGDGDGEEYED